MNRPHCLPQYQVTYQTRCITGPSVTLRQDLLNGGDHISQSTTPFQGKLSHLVLMAHLAVSPPGVDATLVSPSSERGQLIGDVAIKVAVVRMACAEIPSARLEAGTGQPSVQACPKLGLVFHQRASHDFRVVSSLRRVQASVRKDTFTPERSRDLLRSLGCTARGFLLRRSFSESYMGYGSLSNILNLIAPAWL